jgi:phosphoheptose isomerase
VSNKYIEDLIARRPSLAVCKSEIERFAETLTECYQRGGKILVCGNGGSCGDSGHIVGELMKGFRLPRPTPIHRRLQTPLRAIDLTAQTNLITAIVNDIGSEYIFAQQVLGYADKGDVFIGISTSGNSVDVLNAAEIAGKLGAVTVGLTGAAGGKLAPLCDVTVRIPETETFRVQEEHIAVYHTVCMAVEEEMFR